MERLSGSMMQTVLKELGSGESLKWSGQPDPKTHLWRAMGLFLFAIPWTAFSLFWMAGAAEFKIPDFSEPFDFFPLFGLPFLLIGIGMLASPYYAYLTAKRTLYVVTSKRAFEMKVGNTIKVKNYPASVIDGIEKVEKADGSGNVLFSTEARSGEDGRKYVKAGFIGIRDVRIVEKYIRDLKEKG